MKIKFFVIIFFVISIVPLLDLLHPGLPITHDGQDHVARIANFYQSLSEGNVIPRWAGNLNWGYGHPILMFLYPLPSYMASLFHFVSFSLVDSTKIVFAVAFVLGGIFMYLWVRSFLGELPGFFAGMLYIFAPYRFVDLYVRGALGEHVAFVFPPLVAYFLFRLSKKYSYWSVIGGSLSLAGLILSHNAISLMFLPIIVFYALYLCWQNIKEWKLIASRYTLIAILGFGLSAFFWIPAFLEGKYTLRDVVTAGEFSSRFTSLQDLIYGQWNYGISGQFSTQVGIVQWIVFILSFPAIAILYKKKDKAWVLASITLLIFLIILFLMMPISKPIWDNLTTLQKFQFPWRFLTVAVFTTALLGGLVLSTVPKKIKLITCYLLLITSVWFNKDYWHAKDYLLEKETFFTSTYKSTTDTGESSPIWSVRFMEKEPKARIEVINGKAGIQELKRTSTYHAYGINTSQKVRIRENTLFFPGWEVFVDGKKVNIEFQDPANRGLLTFLVEQGQHQIEVKFRETKLRFIADSMSVATLAIVLLYGIIQIKSL